MRTLHVALPILLLAGLLGSCSQPATRSGVGTLQPSPGAEHGEDRLSELLAQGGQRPRCPEGAELQQARAAHVEEERSREAREAGQRAQAGEWFLGSEGLSDGEVVLVAGKPIPDEQAVAVLTHAFSRGVTHWDTAESCEWRPPRAARILLAPRASSLAH